MRVIKLKIITPEKVLVSQDCKVISLMSTAGMIEIMYGCENMLLQLKEGDIVYDHTNRVSIKSGFAKINHNVCEIIVEM